MLPRSPRKHKSVGKVSSARRRYYDSRRPGYGMLTRCWETNSFCRVRPADIELPPLPKNRRDVVKVARERHHCFDKFRQRQRKPVRPVNGKKPTLRSVVKVPMKCAHSN